MSDRSNNQPPPWETEHHTAHQMYRCETTNGAVIYVVADGFDAAVRKVHHHYWREQFWPVIATEDGTPVYGEVSSVALSHRVIL